MNIDEFYEKEEILQKFYENGKSERRKLCYKLIMDLIKEKLRNQCVKRILDIGCGDGSFTKMFKGYAEVFGVDISFRAVEKAREFGVNAKRLDVSNEELPFEDDFFDIVFMGEVIEHLVNPDFSIEQAKRVLKAGGFLVLSTPNLACWYNRLLILGGIQPVFSEVSLLKIFGRPGFSPAGHLRLFTLRALKEFLEYHGFKIMKIAGAPFDNLPKIIRTIDKLVSKIPSLSSIIIVVARKNNTPRKMTST